VVVAEQLLEPGSCYVLEGQAVQGFKHSVSDPSNSEVEKVQIDFLTNTCFDVICGLACLLCDDQSL
jgi:hypothetical protein